jgi:hypothetical protein
MRRPILAAITTLILISLGARLALAEEAYQMDKLSRFFQQAQTQYLQTLGKYSEPHKGWSLAEGRKKLLQQAMWQVLEQPSTIDAANANGETPYTAIPIDGDAAHKSILDLARQEFPTSYANLDNATALVTLRAQVTLTAGTVDRLRAYNGAWAAESKWTILSRVNAASKNDPFDAPAALAKGDQKDLAVYIAKVDTIVDKVQDTVAFKIPDNKRWAVYEEMVKQGGAITASKTTVPDDLKGVEPGTLDPMAFAERYRKGIPPGVLNDLKQETYKAPIKDQDVQ